VSMSKPMARKSLRRVQRPKGQFTKGELYIFVVDYEGLTLAHGGNANLVGKKPERFPGRPDGKLFLQGFIEQAKKGGGWVDYKWTIRHQEGPGQDQLRAADQRIEGLPGLRHLQDRSLTHREPGQGAAT